MSENFGLHIKFIVVNFVLAMRLSEEKKFPFAASPDTYRRFLRAGTVCSPVRPIPPPLPPNMELDTSLSRVEVEACLGAKSRIELKVCLGANILIPVLLKELFVCVDS